MARPHPEAARIVPEVVQTSMMDCGPAALMALLQGFGVRVSFGRLREACQTTVDGTSISTLDDVANMLGLETEEIMIPSDHLLLPEADALPAIAVIRNEVGLNHFVVVWSVVGPWVQIMDPAQGRRWIRKRDLAEQLTSHMMPISLEMWRAWTRTDEFQLPLQRRLCDIGFAPERARTLREQALAPEGWRAVAALDASCRAASRLTLTGAVHRGREAVRLVERMFEYGCDPERADVIPITNWLVRPGDDDDELLFRAVVIVCARGPREPPDPDALTGALADALTDERPRPGRTLLAMLAEDGLLAPIAVAVALVGAALLVVVEAVLLRGFLELGDQLVTVPQRAAAVVALVLVLLLVMATRLPVLASVFAMGRALEARLRTAFLSKLPRLSDRYFHSRLISDMAERCHTLHLLRAVPLLGMQLVEDMARIAFTTAGIVWLAPELAPWAIGVAVVSIGLPLALQPVLAERDLRVRAHVGALVRFYLDALLGLVPIRVHGAQMAVAREQEEQLVEWRRAATHYHATATWVEGALALAGFGMAVLMVSLVAAGDPGGALLLVYWALGLPALGQRVAQFARRYPSMRSVALRALEPLGAREEDAAGAHEHLDARDEGTAGGRSGAAIALADVTVEAGGHVILSEVSVQIAPGEHVAVVGPSGAGKSSLVGVLLGWYTPTSGEVEVDGAPLDGAALGALRRQTAWVDPAVQLWNRPLLDNLLYGAEDSDALATVLGQAELLELLELLPDGLQTPLGEGGRLVSGGEGQRIRLGRALARRDARLVLFDEAFRGLDRDARRRFTRRARAWWADATMLFVSHDITDTREFDRVLVVEDGQIVEDAAPEALLATEGSRYRALWQADEAMRQHAWASGAWRRVWIDGGRLREEAP